MSLDQHKNLAYSTVLTAPTPATSGLSLVLQSGDGAKFPTAPFNVTIWPAGVLPTTANSEIARCTALVSDTMTLVRATTTESVVIGPRSVVVGDQVAATITAKTLQDVEGRYLGQSFRGLHLRTHPDGDVAASKVMLIKADEIVMDDGERTTGWAGQVADITASGAGGLDAGSEGASRWYELHAIAKEDGTKALLLHRSKDYLLSEQQTTSDGGITLRFGASTQVKLGQSFTVGTAGQVPFIDVRLNAATSAPTGNVWFTIEGDSGGFPSGTPLATSDKMNAALINTTDFWIRFVFRSPATLALSTTYHLVMQGDYTPSSTVAIKWQANTAGGYANGRREAFDSSWSATAGHDMSFKIYVTENDAAVTLPATYTKKCLLGFVYNNGSSNFKPFVQRDRYVRFHVITGEDPGTITSTLPTLFDLSAYIPPRFVTLWMTGYNDANGSYVMGGGVPDSYTMGNLNGNGSVAFLNPSGENTIEAGVASILTETQALYARVPSGNGHLLLHGYEW